MTCESYTTFAVPTLCYANPSHPAPHKTYYFYALANPTDKTLPKSSSPLKSLFYIISIKNAINLKHIITCSLFIFREYKDIMIRLTKMIRGIANPLVSMYARCYLCRVSSINCNILLMISTIIVMIISFYLKSQSIN